MGNFLSTLFDNTDGEYVQPAYTVQYIQPTVTQTPIAIQTPAALGNQVAAQVQTASQRPVILPISVDELTPALDSDGNPLPPIRISSARDTTAMYPKGVFKGEPVKMKAYDGSEKMKILLFRYVGSNQQMLSGDYKFFKFVQSGLWLNVESKKDGMLYLSPVPHPFELKGEYLTDPVSGLVATYSRELRRGDVMYLSEPTDSKPVEQYQKYVIVRDDGRAFLQQMSSWSDANWKSIAIQAAALTLVGYAGYQIGKRRNLQK